MKKVLFAILALSGAITGFSQTDTTGNDQKPDTIKVGGMIIVKKHGKNDDDHKDITISNRHHSKSSNVTTNWWIVDLGFANYDDKTNYGSAQSQAFAPGSNKDRLNLRNGKSVNVNLWFFMQRLNVIKHVVNLKYGLGLELNNYRFDDESVHFHKNPTLITFDETNVSKNKLAADYITVPLMLNVNFTPGRNKGFGF